MLEGPKQSGMCETHQEGSKQDTWVCSRGQSRGASGLAVPARSDGDASLQPYTLLIELLDLRCTLVVLCISLQLVPQAGQGVERGRYAGPQSHGHHPLMWTCTQAEPS